MITHIEDIKEELKVLADLLDDGFFGGDFSEKERTLLVELTVMKLRNLSKE
jgi:hypothetical protein